MIYKIIRLRFQTVNLETNNLKEYEILLRNLLVKVFALELVHFYNFCRGMYSVNLVAYNFHQYIYIYIKNKELARNAYPKPYIPVNHN